MACTTVTINAPLTIANLNAADAGGLKISLWFDATGSGNVDIKLDGTKVGTVNVLYSGQWSYQITNVTPGTHQVCAEPV